MPLKRKEFVKESSLYVKDVARSVTRSTVGRRSEESK